MPVPRNRPDPFLTLIGLGAWLEPPFPPRPCGNPGTILTFASTLLGLFFGTTQSGVLLPVVLAGASGYFYLLSTSLLTGLLWSP